MVGRSELLDLLAKRILAVGSEGPTKVAIDGMDAAGKTTLADELAAHPALQSSGREMIRASIDGFHRPRAQRYRRGADSAEGYYLDSFDNAALEERLLKPLGPGGSRVYTGAIFDFKKDQPVDATPLKAREDAVLLLRRGLPPAARTPCVLGPEDLSPRSLRDRPPQGLPQGPRISERPREDSPPLQEPVPRRQPAVYRRREGRGGRGHSRRQRRLRPPHSPPGPPS
jgi:hypothetical protein